MEFWRLCYSKYYINKYIYLLLNININNNKLLIIIIINIIYTVIRQNPRDFGVIYIYIYII